MRFRIVTAGVGSTWESALVRACQDGTVRAVVVQRCHDVGDLLAVAAAGKAELALVASAMRWLDREAVARLGSAGLAIVGVVPAGDEDAERRMRQLGIDHVAQGTARPGTLIELGRVALTRRSHQPFSPDADDRVQRPDHPAGTGIVTRLPWPASRPQPAPTDPPTPATSSGDGTASAAMEPNPPWTAADEPGDVGAAAPDGRDHRNALVVVWGPKGAPGRTTIAVNLAFEVLPFAGETLLVDADTYGGSISQTLGFLEDHPGLAWAARLASRGELDGPKLWQATRRAGPAGPRVLSGLPRAALWTELRPSTWESLLELFRLRSHNELRRCNSSVSRRVEDHGKRAGGSHCGHPSRLIVHHGSPASLSVFPTGGCCPSAAQAATSESPSLGWWCRVELHADLLDSFNSSLRRRLHGGVKPRFGGARPVVGANASSASHGGGAVAGVTSYWLYATKRGERCRSLAVR
jgi:hypothetical protein